MTVEQMLPQILLQSFDDINHFTYDHFVIGRCGPVGVPRRTCLCTIYSLSLSFSLSISTIRVLLHPSIPTYLLPYREPWHIKRQAQFEASMEYGHDGVAEVGIGARRLNFIF